MDQYSSTVIIAIITGVFSIITLVIQKKQDKVISKIDEQTTFIDREKKLKQKLREREKERDSAMQKIMLLILETNMFILQNTNIGDGKLPIDNLFKQSEDLKSKISSLEKEIEEINEEYTLVLDITSEFQREIERNQRK